MLLGILVVAAAAERPDRWLRRSDDSNSSSSSVDGLLDADFVVTIDNDDMGVAGPMQRSHTNASSRTNTSSQSVCERLCPQLHAQVVLEEECDVAVPCEPCERDDCHTTHPASTPQSSTSTGSRSRSLQQDVAVNSLSVELCEAERATCRARRYTRDRLWLVVWVSIAGTSFYILVLLGHIYRQDSLRRRVVYTGLPNVTPASTHTMRRTGTETDG